jgi:hypothetical protein
MKKEDFSELLKRLRVSSISADLKTDIVQALLWHRTMLEDVYVGAQQGSKSTAQLAGIALGKDGFAGGDMGF